MKVGIVYGGTSSEKIPSTHNAESINEVLVRLGYDTLMLPYDHNLIQRLLSEQIGIVFICVQGKGHGDGTIQALLDFLGIPYTGSGMTSAAIINDKIQSKLLFEHYGQPTPEWSVLRKADCIDNHDWVYPFVAKAPSGGGSFGIELIGSEEELPLMDRVFEYDDPILLERYIRGTAYTIGVLEQDGALTALPCVEMIDERKTGDGRITLMSGKYGARKASLPKPLESQMRKMALDIFKQTGALDYARVDFMVEEETGNPYVLEINAVPGLKHESLLPIEVSLTTMGYDDLIEGILLNAARRAKLCLRT